jgi:tetratricopeptide (TPR) repeat protein
MQSERYGTHLSTWNAAAARNVETAAFRIFAHRPDVDGALVAAIAEDASCIAAHALRGLCQVTLARADSMWRARGHLARAQAAMRQGAASMDEAALVRALAFAVHGGLRAAAEVLEAELADRPGLALFAKLAQALRFMIGDIGALARGVDLVLEHLDEEASGFGFLLGCKAFACEEVGAFEQAEELGRRAVAIQPADAWGMHAVGHVYEMTARPEEGLAWIDALKPVWQSCNNFALHMSWHAALFHVERRDHAGALALFDNDVWPRASSDFRDLSNAVSLLTRLEFFGVDVGTRWDAIADVAASQRHDGTYVFASLHNLVALLAVGRRAEAADLLETFERPCLPGNDQGRVLRAVGRPLARVLVEAENGRGQRFDAKPLIEAMPMLGGSGAQRDLFMRLLGNLAAGQGDAEVLADVLAARRLLKQQDRFDTVVRERLADQRVHLREIA